MGAIAVMVAMFGIIYLANMTDSLRYFYYTLVIMFGMFVYFEFFKEYKETRSKS